MKKALLERKLVEEASALGKGVREKVVCGVGTERSDPFARSSRLMIVPRCFEVLIARRSNFIQHANSFHAG